MSERVGADLAAIEARQARRRDDDAYWGQPDSLPAARRRLGEVDADLTSALALVGQLQGQLDRVWALITKADTYTGEYIHVDMLHAALAAVLSDREGKPNE
jgi:hypothetical protein